MKITDLLNSDNKKIDEALPALAIPAAVAAGRALAPAITQGASRIGNVIRGAFGKPGAAPTTPPAGSSNVTPIRPGGPTTPPATPAGSSNVTPIRPGGPTTPQTAGGGRPPAANEPAAGTGSQPSFVPAGQQAQPVSLTGRPTAPGAGTQAGGTVQQRTIPAPAPAPAPTPTPSTASQVQRAASGAVGATAAAAGVGAFDEPAPSTTNTAAAPAPAPTAKSGDAAIQATDDAELARIRQLAGSTQADGDKGEAAAKQAQAQSDAEARSAAMRDQQALGSQGEAAARTAQAQSDSIAKTNQLAGSTQADGDEGEAAARTAQAQADTVDRADADMGAAMTANAQPKPADEPAPELAMGAGKPATQPQPAAAQAAAPTDAKPTPPATDAKQIAAPVPPPSQQTVKSGSTLSQIAKDNNTTVAAMMSANPELKNPDAIRAGMKLNIPTGGTSTNPYAGGVGTAADTAKKVASGEFASYQDALKAIPRGDVDKPVAPGSVQTTAGTWKAGEKGTIDAPVLSRGNTGTTPSTGSSARSDAEARSAAMRDQQALGGQGGDKPTPPAASPAPASRSVTAPTPAASPEARQSTTTRSISSNNATPYQPGLDAAQRNADNRIARLMAQRDASPEWQNAPTTTTTSPDGKTVTSNRSASWTVPPNPNAPPEIARRDFEESLARLRQLIGHRS